MVAPRGRREPRRRRAARVRVRRGVRRAQEPGGHEPARRRNVRRQDRREDPTSMYASRELRARRVGDAAVDAHVGRDDRHRGRPARRGGAVLGADGAQGDGPVGVGRGRRWVAVGECDSPGRRRRERDEDFGGCDRTSPPRRPRAGAQVHAGDQGCGGGAGVRVVRARGAEPRGRVREVGQDAGGEGDGC